MGFNVTVTSSVASFIGIPFLRETYAPIIQAKIAKKRGDVEAVSETCNQPRKDTSNWRYLWINLTRPIILLTTSLICFMLSLYMAL